MSSTDRMTRLDRIKKAIDDETDIALSDEERREKEELLVCCGMLLDVRKVTSSIIKILMNEHGLSHRTAFRRIADAKFVFGVGGTVDRAFEKLKAIQRSELAWEMARKQKYVDGMTRANDQIAKLHELDKDDRSAIDPTMLEPSQYKLVGSGDTKKAIRKMLDEGVVDISQMLIQSGHVVEAKVVDTTATEVDDDDDDDPLK